MDGERWALRKRVRGAFSLAFFGWVLVFFHIKVSGFDLLPDTIGYILVAIACARLEDLHRAFAPVRWLAIMLSLVSLVMVLVPPDVQALWAWVAILMQMATMAWFCTSIATAAIEHHEEGLAAIARNRRNWMIATFAGSWMVLAMIPRVEMALLLGVMAVVLLCFFLGLVRRAARIAW